MRLPSFSLVLIDSILIDSYVAIIKKGGDCCVICFDDEVTYFDNIICFDDEATCFDNMATSFDNVA